MDSLPPEIVGFISSLRPLMRAEVSDSFCFLFMGVLVGKPSTAQSAQVSLRRPPTSSNACQTCSAGTSFPTKR